MSASQPLPLAANAASTPIAGQTQAHAEWRGLALGLAGVLMFSLTLPMTHIVVRELDPLLNGLGRALLAALPAGLLLWWRKSPLPTRAQCRTLIWVAAGVIVAFPVFSAWSMKTLPASHGAMLVGLLPLCVALYAAWLAHERLTLRFWLCALLGSAIVVGFTLRSGGGALQSGDLLMLVAVVIGALGYAQGGRLAREMGGWQVICWALVLSAPFLLLPVSWLAWHHQEPVSPHTWLAFAYVTLFSQLIGFFVWYAGLAAGGIARVGQVQLLQIFFTLAFSALFFGEHVEPVTWIFAAAVVACVALGRKSGRALPRPV